MFFSNVRNDMKIFENSEFGAVRVVDVNGEPWFVARDVAKALGYQNTVQAVNTHCKKVNDFRYSKMLPSATPMKIIPESDVYRLVMRSNDAVNTHCKKVNKFSYGDMPQGAEAFGKRHDHVIRDIREVMAKCTESFTAPNFGLSEYTDSTGRSLDGVESDIDN